MVRQKSLTPSSAASTRNGDAASKSRDNEKSRRYNFNEAGDIFEENAAESEGDKSTGHSWDDPDWKR